MILERAAAADLDRVVRFRGDAIAWLRERASDQWSTPFPVEQIAASIAAGQVYLLKDDGAAVATITLDRWADPLLYSDSEQQECAAYAHKLTVDRSHSGRGLGAELLDWASDQAAAAGIPTLRIDAWASSRRLHEYYVGLGFQHVRTVPDDVSGWLAERPARRLDHELVFDVSPGLHAFAHPLHATFGS